MKTCPLCDSHKIIIFDSDNDYCQKCKNYFPALADTKDDSLQDLVKDVIEALRFYAKEENYHYIPVGRRKRHIDPETLVDKDGGNIARDILTKLNKKKAEHNE